MNRHLRRPFVLGALLLTGTHPCAGQARPGLERARLLLRQGQYDSAAVLARGVLARDSSDAAAWVTLGTALRSTGDAGSAIPALRRALRPGASRPAAMYQLGLAFAGTGRPDSAFAWLERAKRTGSVNLADLDVEPATAGLRADPRYRRLKPSPAELDHPFVEPARVLREWRGEDGGDQFGWIARDIGDVDGDGVHDVVTSAPSRAAGGEAAGAVYAFSSRAGSRLWRVDGAPGERLGTGVESAGDVDGDGVPDVVATAPGSGRAYVFDGRTGRRVRVLSLPGALRADGAGDVNGDGHADVVVGSPTARDGAGAAAVFSGADGSVLLSLHGSTPGARLGSAVAGGSGRGRPLLVVGAAGAGSRHTGAALVYRDLDTVPAFAFEGDSTSAALGAMFVSVPGDVDGDGEDDVYVSDWANAAHGASTGRIHVLSGRDGRRILTLTGENAGDGFGTCAARVGDVDGDGRADLVIGAWQFAGAAPSGGKIYLYSGGDGSLLRTWTGRVPGETLGFDAVGIGDVDGDGTVDVLVSSAWSSVHGSRSGRVFILSGARGRGEGRSPRP